jgi:hypothetical protein
MLYLQIVAAIICGIIVNFIEIQELKEEREAKKINWI